MATMVSAMRLFPNGLMFWNRYGFGARRLLLAGFNTFNDSVLSTQRHGFAVPLSRLHTAQTKFFLQDQSTLDDEDLLNNGDDCRVALFPKRWNGLDWTADRDTLDLDLLVSKRLVYQLVMTICTDMHPNGPLDPATLNRNILDKQRYGHLGEI
jgi:hypothetical protein